MTTGEAAPRRTNGEGAVRHNRTAKQLYHEPHAAQGAKALAVWLFNIGARGLGETQETFNRNYAWRSS